MPESYIFYLNQIIIDIEIAKSMYSLVLISIFVLHVFLIKNALAKIVNGVLRYAATTE